MNIEHYIFQLLYRYQCVTVPDFGAFLTTVQPAQLIDKSNSFLPPRKLLSFNSHLKNNDGLLANHIALSEKTSYENALKMIRLQVKNWEIILAKNELLSLKNIGNVEISADNFLIFTTYDQINYLSTSFGLSAFVSPAVKRQVYKQQVLAVDESPVDHYEIKFAPAIKRKNAFIRYAAIVVLGLGLTTTIGYPVYKQQVENETVLIEQAVQRQVQNKIQEATFFIEFPVKAESITMVEEKMPYHIVAAAFNDEKNAQKELEQLVKNGFNAKRIPQNKFGLYPVIYGSYANLAEAEAAKQKIRNTFNPEAWLLIQSL